MLVTMQEYQNIKPFCKSLRSKLNWGGLCYKKVKNTVPGTYVTSDLNGEAIVETFYKKRTAKNKAKKNLE